MVILKTIKKITIFLLFFIFCYVTYIQYCLWKIGNHDYYLHKQYIKIISKLPFSYYFLENCLKYPTRYLSYNATLAIMSMEDKIKNNLTKKIDSSNTKYQKNQFFQILMSQKGIPYLKKILKESKKEKIIQILENIKELCKKDKFMFSFFRKQIIKNTKMSRKEKNKIIKKYLSSD
jgi:K+-sensing histidine kinase KdpD